MRFFQPVVMILGVVTYVTVFWSLGEATETGNYLLPLAIVGVWNLLVLIAAVVTIVDSVLKIRARKSQQLATDAMVTKLASAPFFVLTFFVLIGLEFMGLAILLFGGPVLWVIAPIIGSMTYVVMLSTSVYGWAAIIQMRRERIIGRVLSVVYAILLVLPVADTVVGVLLFGRRRPRLALIVGLLELGVLLIASALIISSFGIYPNERGEIEVNSVGVASIAIAVIGLGVMVFAGIFSRMRRSTLRTESQHAALAPATRNESDVTDDVFAG